MRKDIQRVRDRVDYVVLSLHWEVLQNQETHEEEQKFARLTLAKGGAIPRFEILPMAGRHQDRDIFQPWLLQGERAQELLRDIQARSARLHTDLTIEGEVGVIRPMQKTAGMDRR